MIARSEEKHQNFSKIVFCENLAINLLQLLESCSKWWTRRAQPRAGRAADMDGGKALLAAVRTAPEQRLDRMLDAVWAEDEL